MNRLHQTKYQLTHVNRTHEQATTLTIEQIAVDLFEEVQIEAIVEME